MEKGANDSRDSGHHRRHLGDCDSALHHRGSVLLPAPGTRGIFLLSVVLPFYVYFQELLSSK